MKWLFEKNARLLVVGGLLLLILGAALVDPQSAELLAEVLLKLLGSN